MSEKNEIVKIRKRVRVRNVKKKKEKNGNKNLQWWQTEVKFRNSGFREGRKPLEQGREPTTKINPNKTPESVTRTQVTLVKGGCCGVLAPIQLQLIVSIIRQVKRVKLR